MKSKYILYSILWYLVSGQVLYATVTNIAVLGCGFVGLTVAGLFAVHGHNVVGIDCDTKKIVQLQQDIIPIYEPHLDEWILDKGRNQLTYTSNVEDVRTADIIIISVPTPTDHEGYADLSYLKKAFNDVIAVCDDERNRIVCIKSTVPPGTLRVLQKGLTENKNDHISLVYNPEFMREGCAVDDIYINPVLLGGDSAVALDTMETLYRSIVKTDIIITSSFETVEITKYAWNTFLATRLTCINELALLCRAYNADIATLIRAIAVIEEHRPLRELQPGPGYGGSCFPKDTQALATVMHQHGLSPSVVHQVIASNKNIQEGWKAAIISKIDDIHNKIPVVTLLGLAFKANTDDIRYSIAIDIIDELLKRGVSVQAYDPQAMSNMAKLFPEVIYCDSPYSAIADSDCIVVLTDWQEFKQLDLARAAILSNQQVFLDTRNLYNPTMLKKHGFSYLSMGI